MEQMPTRKVKTLEKCFAAVVEARRKELAKDEKKLVKAEAAYEKAEKNWEKANDR